MLQLLIDFHSNVTFGRFHFHKRPSVICRTVSPVFRRRIGMDEATKSCGPCDIEPRAITTSRQFCRLEEDTGLAFLFVCHGERLAVKLDRRQ
jgi:hypothetical protein